MMNSQELETAVRLKLNLVVLILQDNAYGMIRWKQAVDDFPDFGLTFGNPDFVKYAEAYGATGSRVESTEGLATRLCVTHSTPAACIWSPCRSTIPRTSECWSTSCATGFRIRRRCDCGDQSRSARGDGCRIAVREFEAADHRDALELDPPGPGEVLVRIKAAGLCHSDLSVINGNRPRPMPMALGHEAAGIVEEVGPVEGGWGIGSASRVIMSFSCSCPRAGIASRARWDDRPCASRVRPRTGRGRCCRAAGGCTARTGPRSTITWGFPRSPTMPPSRVAHWSRSTRICPWTRPPCSVVRC